MGISFGVAGLPDGFPYKSTLDAPRFLSEIGLDAFEYQCGRGVRISSNTANELLKQGQEHKIKLSIHSPYFISLASPDERIQNNSIDYILQTLKASKAIGSDRIVVHMGGIGKGTRQAGMANTKKLVEKLLFESQEFHDIFICFETMGKINQLGTVDEVLEICSMADNFLPCIDFGHLNARTLGGIKTKQDYIDILDAIENKLGNERMRKTHVHFSKIMYTTGGEKKHLTFADTEYGPNPDLMLEALVEKNAEPVIICESAGTQDIDAKYMKDKYYEILTN